MTLPANPRWRLWLPLLLGAGGLALFGNRTPTEAIVSVSPGPKAERAYQTGGPLPGSAKTEVTSPMPGAQAVHAILPLDRAQLFPLAPVRKPARDLFAAVAWLPAPSPLAPAALPRGDVAPPLPLLTVLGKKYEAPIWEVYLARGDQTLIAREGMALDGGLRVDSIAPPTMNLTLTSTGQTMSLDIGEAR